MATKGRAEREGEKKYGPGVFGKGQSMGQNLRRCFEMCPVWWRNLLTGVGKSKARRRRRGSRERERGEEKREEGRKEVEREG